MSKTQEKPASEATLTEEEMFAAATPARSVDGTIENKTDKKMIYLRTKMIHGIMKNSPTEEIAAGKTGHFFAESSGFMTGVEGFVYYHLDGEGTVAMYFNNPYTGSNKYKISVPGGFTGSWGGGGGNNAKVTYTVRD